MTPSSGSDTLLLCHSSPGLSPPLTGPKHELTPLGDNPLVVQTSLPSSGGLTQATMNDSQPPCLDDINGELPSKGMGAFEQSPLMQAFMRGTAAAQGQSMLTMAMVGENLDSDPRLQTPPTKLQKRQNQKRQKAKEAPVQGCDQKSEVADAGVLKRSVGLGVLRSLP